jgi:hypothetical protein
VFRQQAPRGSEHEPNIFYFYVFQSRLLGPLFKAIIHIIKIVESALAAH